MRLSLTWLVFLATLLFPPAIAAQSGDDAMAAYQRGDYAAAVRLTRPACDQQHIAQACQNMAAFYQQGEGVPKDRGQETAYFRKACDLGLAESCRNVAIALSNGLGVAKNDAAAANFARRACDGNDGIGCRMIGVFHVAALGTSQDLARADAEFRQGCRAGDSTSCGLVQKLQADMAKMNQDASRAPTAAASAPAASTAAPVQNNCITAGPGAGSFWKVTNNCPKSVIGSLCFVNDKYFNCGTQVPVGFGPIAVGGSEAIHGPSSAQARYRYTACFYDDWNKGRCHYQSAK